MILLRLIKSFREKKREKIEIEKELLLKKYREIIKQRKKENDEIIKQYNDFINSDKEKIGMTISEIKSLYPDAKMKCSTIVKSSSKSVCQSCGGKIINGKCEYCGNEYIDDSETIILEYECKFGIKKYIFKQGKLISINSNAKPIEEFLI